MVPNAIAKSPGERSDMAVQDETTLLPFTRPGKLKITLISLHGLIRAHDLELGRDADTGGQVKYVLELARELAAQPNVREVELLTRQIIDPSVDDDYAQLQEPISENAKIVRIPFGPKRYLRKESLWPYIEMFIDQTLPHFKRTDLPDIIHGHYADAGLAGASWPGYCTFPLFLPATHWDASSVSGSRWARRTPKRWRGVTNSPRGSKPRKSPWKPPP